MLWVGSCRGWDQDSEGRATRWRHPWNPPWPRRWCLPWELRRNHATWTREMRIVQKKFNKFLLGVGLFKEGAPEFILLRGAQENQLAIVSGQSVVYDHIYPAPILPKSSKTIFGQWGLTEKINNAACARKTLHVCGLHSRTRLILKQLWFT